MIMFEFPIHDRRIASTQERVLGVSTRRHILKKPAELGCLSGKEKKI